MLRITILSALMLVPLANTATAQSETPEETIAALFDAMRSGDGDAVRQRAREGAVLQRARPDGAQDLAFEDWASWIDSLEPGQADEQIFAVKTREFGHLASVWAPFVISLNDKIAGCGINHFTLARDGDRWIVIHGADTPFDGDCDTFQSLYRAETDG
ncbi:MAG: hypothetical protein AAFY34_09000 [Pseudomonadota bacterium]